MTTLEDLSRPVLIHVCKDRTLSYTHGDQRGKAFNNMALPVYSVNTVEEAEQLITTLGCRQYKEHPQLPGKPWLKINYFRSGPNFGEFVQCLELTDLPGVADKIANVYVRMNAFKAFVQ